MANYKSAWFKRHQIAAERDVRCVLDLGQNSKFARPKLPGTLPTFKASHGILYMPAKGRWLLPLERGLAMGFPCTADAAAAAAVQVDTVTCSMPNAATYIGNSFHVANAGAVLVAVLLSLGHPLPKHYRPDRC